MKNDQLDKVALQQDATKALLSGSDSAIGDATDIHRSLFSFINYNLHIIPASEFILRQNKLEKKIAELLKEIDEKFTKKVTKIAKETSSKSRTGQQQSVLSESFPSEIGSDIKNLKKAVEELKKRTQDMLKVHFPLCRLEYSKAGLKKGLDRMRDRLLDRVPFECFEQYAGPDAESKKAEQGKIKEQIGIFCELTHIWVQQKKYKGEGEFKKTCIALNLWSEKFEEALAELKEAHMKEAAPNYKDKLKAVHNMLSMMQLEVLFKETVPFTDLRKRQRRINRFSNLLLMPSAIFSVSCFLSRLFNIMPKSNPLLRLSKKQANASYLTTVSLFSAHLIFYVVRCGSTIKRINGLISRLDEAKKACPQPGGQQQ